MIKLLILHFVADFILQPREMGKKKSSDIRWLAAHLAIQFIVFAPFTSLVFAAANACVHGIIDGTIWNIYKLSVRLRNKNATAENWRYWDDHLFYTTIGFDQLLHGLTLVILMRLV